MNVLVIPATSLICGVCGLLASGLMEVSPGGGFVLGAVVGAGTAIWTVMNE